MGEKNSSRRRLMILASTFCLVNVLLWFAAPWLHYAYNELLDRETWPNQVRSRPSFYFWGGVGELLVYFDLALALYVLPTIYTIGLVAIAGSLPTTAYAGKRFVTFAIAMLLIGLELVWGGLVAFQTLFRGPHWGFVLPWEHVGQNHFISTASFSYSHRFHYHLIGPDGNWRGHMMLFETPGLLLAIGYFLLGCFIALRLAQGKGAVLAYWTGIVWLLYLLTPLVLQELGIGGFGSMFVAAAVLLPVYGCVLVAGYVVMRYLWRWMRDGPREQPLPYWRCVAFVFLVQLALLVPLKMILYWSFDLKYFVRFPSFTI